MFQPPSAVSYHDLYFSLYRLKTKILSSPHDMEYQNVHSPKYSKTSLKLNSIIEKKISIISKEPFNSKNGSGEKRVLKYLHQIRIKVSSL